MARSDYIVALKSVWLIHEHPVACGSVARTGFGVWVRSAGVSVSCWCVVWVWGVRLRSVGVVY